jgi:hypothetical protein
VPQRASLPGLSAVLGFPGGDRQDVDDVGVVRVDHDLAVVVGRLTADRLVVGIHLAPRRTRVVRAVDLAADHARRRLVVQQFPSALLVRHAFLVGVLDRRVDDVRVAVEDVDPDPSEHAHGESLGEHLPRVAAVGRLVDPAARSPEVVGERQPHLVEAGRVQDVRVERVHRDVDDADVASFRHRGQHLLPRGAPVGGAVEPALLVLGVEVPEGRHVHHVGIVGMDHDPADVVRLGQADVGPRLSAVRGLVDAVAPVAAARVVRLAGAQVEDVRVGARDVEVPDREDALVVEEHLERLPVVLGLPEVARGRGHVENLGLAGGHRDVDEATTLPGRADAAVVEGAQLVLREHLSRRGTGNERNERRHGREGSEERPTLGLHDLTFLNGERVPGCRRAG